MVLSQIIIGECFSIRYRRKLLVSVNYKIIIGDFKYHYFYYRNSNIGILTHNLMEYFQSKKDKILNYLFVILIVSLFSGITGAFWDVTYHAVNKVDNFFQPAHLVIYSSLFLVFITGIIITIMFPKKFLFAVIPASLLLAGYFDLLWHNNFGFDSFKSSTCDAFFSTNFIFINDL